MTQGSHVHPNLMRPASVDLQLEQGELAEPRVDPSFHCVVRDGFAPARSPGGHACPTYAVAADTAVNRAPIQFYPALDQRDIRLLHLPARKLRCQFAVCRIVLCYDDQPA